MNDRGAFDLLSAFCSVWNNSSCPHIAALSIELIVIRKLHAFYSIFE
jgi:hypothetical protein